MKRGLLLLTALVVLVVVVNACTSSAKKAENSAVTVTMFKSPTCACCAGHKAYLENAGFTVNVVESQNLALIKEKKGVPPSVQSCHTLEFGEYFVEGHVPLEAIEKLLTEKPEVDGIALPRMPAGAPGMPGAKQGDFVVYAVKDGVESEFMRV